MVKAKQVEYLINALPVPEPEETQVWRISNATTRFVPDNGEANIPLGTASASPRGADDTSE